MDEQALSPQDSQELTPAKKRFQKIRKEKLSADGPWTLDWFSPPGEFAKCEHVMPHRTILGGLPIYRCDDCDTYFYIGAGGAEVIPKQHIPAYYLLGLANWVKYEGGDALAQALSRPHVRIDKGGEHYSPIEILNEPEVKEQWAIMLKKLPEYVEAAHGLLALTGETHEDHRELADANGNTADMPDMRDI
jgi:hypothetical protein